MSTTATPSVLYESRLAASAIAAGQPRRRFPLPQNAPPQFAAYAFDQDFEILLANFPPAQKNTPSNAAVAGVPVFAGLLDGNAILTKLSQPTNTAGAKGKFTASFAIIPASWDDFKTQGITFPGWINTGASGLARSARTRNVTVREHYDYFIVDPAGALTGLSIKDSSGVTATVVSSMGKIPMLYRSVWLNTLPSFGPQVNSEVNDLVPAGGVTVGTSTYIVTYPSRDQYAVWISNAATALAGGADWNQSNPTVWDKAISGSNIASAGQYQCADSSLRVYEGNIIERMTPYVIPQ